MDPFYQKAGNQDGTIASLFPIGKPFPADTFYDQWHGGEVDQQSRLDIRCLEIRPDRRKVNGIQIFGGLEFHNQPAADKQIQPVLPNTLSAIG